MAASYQQYGLRGLPGGGGLNNGHVFPPRQPFRTPGGWAAPMESDMGQEMRAAKGAAPVPMSGGYYGFSNPTFAEEGIGVPKGFTGPIHNPMPGLFNFDAQSPQAGAGLMGSTYTARYPQNSNYANLANSLAAQNQAQGLRGPVAPYAQRLMQGYQATQQYAPQGFQGGLPNNAGLAALGPGYQGTRTVGGGYGIANPYAGRQPGYAPYSGQGGGAPSPSPMGLAGPMNALAEQNPNGRWYQGATPGMVAYSGGLRPGFVGGGPSGTASGSVDNEAFAAAHGLHYLPETGTIGGRINPSPGVGGPGGLFSAVGGPATGAYSAGPGAAPMGGGLMGGYGGPTIAAQKQQAARESTLNRVGLRRQNQVDAQQAQMEAINPQYGLAMAGLRQQGQYQQGLLGVQKERLASNERTAAADRGLRSQAMVAQSELAKAQQDLQRYTAEGNWAAAAKAHEATVAAAAKHDEVQQAIATGQQQTQREVAGIGAQAQRDIAKENRGPQHEQIQLQREQLAQQRADSLRQQAQQKYQNGDIQGAQQLESMANQAMAPGLAGGGLAGIGQSIANSGTGNTAVAGLGAQPGAGLAGGGLLGNPSGGGGRIPMAAQPAIDAAIAAHKSNPEQLVQRLRSMGLSDQQINIAMTKAYPREGLFSRRYTHSASNPQGSFFGAVDPNTGKEHFFLPYVGGLIPGMAR